MYLLKEIRADPPDGGRKPEQLSVVFLTRHGRSLGTVSARVAASFRITIGRLVALRRQRRAVPVQCRCAPVGAG